MKGILKQEHTREKYKDQNSGKRTNTSGLRKVKAYNIKNERNIETGTHQGEIQGQEQGKTHRYLGIEESEGIQHQQIEERLKQEYTRRLRMILKFELNARNKITAIGALAVPVLIYSFGIINWRTEEIKKD